MNLHLLQRTLAAEFSCSGIGVHSGQRVNLSVKPAPVNHGIKFYRIDLPGTPCVSAHFNRVVDTSLATVIGEDGCIVSTIEHLMASLSGHAIDNAIVEIDSYELPIMDGSAGPFSDLIRSAGVTEQDRPRCFFMLNAPIELHENGKSVCVYPSNELRISYTIEYDHPLIGAQTASFRITEESFDTEIAKARTFGFLHELEYMQKFGLAKGGSLDNALVVGRDGLINKGGLRFQDEFVRHKILDCIGDFSLLGMPILGHIVLKKSGHAFNHAFLEKFFAEKESWETRTPLNPSDLTLLRPKKFAAHY
jgi:UDP-3-O-[3-hydroxymyristoyl] N-acetylglucosamine deacetylase